MPKTNRCSTRETNGSAWRRCKLTAGHKPKCKFGGWTLSAAASCDRCGTEPDSPDDLGHCAGCERDCCEACLEDGTCRSCLAEEYSQEKEPEDLHATCLQAMSKIKSLCQDAEDYWRDSDNSAMEDRAQGLLDLIAKIGSVTTDCLPE